MMQSVSNTNFLMWENVGHALAAIGVPHYAQFIVEKGLGSTIFAQLKNEGKVTKEAVASWAITEIMGEAVFKWLVDNFNQISLIEHFLSMYKYKIEKQEDKSIGQLFSMIEEIKEDLNIVSYALSQTTLEQIFNRFASEGILERDAKG